MLSQLTRSKPSLGQADISELKLKINQVKRVITLLLLFTFIPRQNYLKFNRINAILYNFIFF